MQLYIRCETRTTPSHLKTLYVPDVRTNLISVAKIIDKGNAVTLTKDGAFVKDSDGNVKIAADRIGDLFYIRGKNEVCAVAVESAVKNESESWHARLGHSNAPPPRPPPPPPPVTTSA